MHAIKKQFNLFISILLLSLQSNALIQIPSSLTKNDRLLVLEMFGCGSGQKLMTNPFPLGGYSGLEVGFAYESIYTDDLSALGASDVPPQTEFAYPKISIGKGLYYDIDIFVHFIPFSENRGISNYGGLLRWNFYEAAFLPATFSVIVHSNSTNLLNQLITRGQGIEGVLGINVENFALYGGAGPVWAKGTFIGNAGGITDTGETETETISRFHTFFGTAVNFEELFFVFQLDRYQDQVVYSTKLGLRL